MVDGDDTKQPADDTNTTSTIIAKKEVDVANQSQSSIANSTSSISASLADVITAKATSTTLSTTAMQVDTPTAEVAAKSSTNDPPSNDNIKMSISNDAPSNAQPQTTIDPKSYYTQIKSQLLSSSTSISTRSTTMELVTNLIKNDVILNPDKISHKKLVGDKSQQLDKEEKEKQERLVRDELEKKRKYEEGLRNRTERGEKFEFTPEQLHEIVNNTPEGQRLLQEKKERLDGGVSREDRQ